MSDDYELPNGWNIRPLGELATTQLGKAVKPKERGLSPQLPYLRNANVQWDEVGVDDVGTMHFSVADAAKYELSEGDLLVCEGGVVGRSAIWRGQVSPCYFQNALHRVRPRDDAVTAEWLLENLRLLVNNGEIASRARGNTILHLSQEALRSLPVVVPPREVADTLLATVSATREKRQHAHARLEAASRATERFRHAVLAAACTGRLTSEWREVNPEPPTEPGPPLSGQATKNASGAPNTSALSDVPDTWSWWAVEAITREVIDYRGRTPPHVAEGPIPHVRTTQIRNGKLDWSTDRFVTQDIYEKYMTRGIPRCGDVLFTMEAPMGEVGVIDRDDPFSIAQRILLLRPSEGVDGRFLALALQAGPVRRAIELRSTGSGVVGIAYKRLRSVEIPRPPLSEQLVIVERVEQLLDLADGVARRIDAAKGRVDRSSQAVLAKAFRGELIPNGVDTQEGPASCP